MIVALSLLLVVPSLDQQERADAPTPDSIIEQYIQAKGGREKLSKVKSYAIKGHMLSDGRRIVEFEVYQAQGRHLSIDRFPNGMTDTHGTDGKTAWRVDTEGRARILLGQDARDYIRHNSTLHEALEWQRQFKVIRFAGTKVVDDIPTHHLIFVAPDNRQVNRYFAIDSGLFIREEQFNGDPPDLVVSKILDYRKGAHGTLISRRRLNIVNGKTQIDIRVDSVEPNLTDIDKIFELPAAVRDLLK